MLGGCLLAADWPQFRGPNGAGVSGDRGLPVEFGPDKNVVWRTSLPPGHSSPILAGKHIFLTAHEGTKLLTVCLDRASGRVLWQKEAPRPRVEYMQPTNSPASPTPASDGEDVYVFFGDFGILSYRADGAERWRVPLGPFNNVNGHGSSPIVVDDMVVLVCDQDTDSYLIGLDKNTGATRWKTPRPEVTRGYATPAVYRPKNGPAELIVPGSYQLISYAAATGEKLWWVRGLAWQLKSVPVIDGGVIYVNGWETGGDTETPPQTPSFEEQLASRDANKDGRLALEEMPPPARRYLEDDLNRDGHLDAREWSFYRLHRTAQNSVMAVRHGGRGDLTDTNVLWRYRKSLPNVPSPLLYQNVLYLIKDGGVMTSLNPKTGEVLKQARLAGAIEQYWASPVAGDGKVYVTSQGGKLTVLRAGGQWETLAMNSLDDDCFATPAIGDGRLYVRTRSALYCFGK
jgi:outer membrane protein assembly factor BamB